MTDSGDVLPQFESSYFNKPNRLYLVIDKVTLIKPNGDSFVDETFDVNQKIKLSTHILQKSANYERANRSIYGFSIIIRKGKNPNK